MKCPKCGFENTENALFCSKCGIKLELICPECEASLAPGSIFCNKCGYNLNESSPTHKELTFEEKLDKVQKYLPKGLTEKILSQRDRIEGERKQVTVMFCDLEGFTPLVEKIGADEAYVIMDQVYELLIHGVHDFDGTVNEMTGDGIMALFGAPIALEDAPQRAIRSALGIHREMARFNDHLRVEKKEFPSLRMRIGIHSGPVVVGTLGNDLRVEFKAVGDTVNLASRMEHLAESGTTYITEDTFKLTEGLFRFEALGTKKIKGKEEPVIVYQVIATSSRRTRFDVSAERGLTTLVGRGRELEILLDGLEMVKSGRGQALSIVAEAGTGKSRLLYEFRKAIANENVTTLEGKCLSFARNVAYRPIIEILKANFRIEDDDEDSVIQEKVVKGLQVIKADEAPTLPYLLDILTVKESGIDQLNITPELKKDRIVESLQRVVVKGSEQRPLIMIFEDLHWVDKTTENVLKELLETIPGSRVLLLFSYRPKYVHAWGGKSYHSQITLNRLSNRESLSMLYHILDTRDIERDLEELVLNKTEGIPFYLEEFVKSLKDLKIIEKREKYCLVKDIHDLAIPSSIQDVIMARVDALPEDAREILQVGSVIEREFSYPLVQQVTDLDEKDLLSRFSALKDSELIYERGIYPDITYIFKHALTREVISDSIITKRKKELHQKIGIAIEVLFREKIEEHYESLVEHFINSEDYNKAANYSKLAVRKAWRSYSYHEIVTFQGKVILCFEHLPQTEDIEEKIIRSRVNLGLFYSEINYIIEAKEAVEPVLKLAGQEGYEKYLSQILTIMGWYYMIVEPDIQLSAEYLEKARQKAEEADDNISSYFVYVAHGWLFWMAAEFEKAVDGWKKSSECELGKSLGNILQQKSGLSHIYFYLGKIDLCFELSSEVQRLAEKGGIVDSTSTGKTVMYSSQGLSYFGKGDFKAAERFFLEESDFTFKHHYYVWYIYVNLLLGDTYFELNNYRESENRFKTVVQTSKQCKMLPQWRDVAIIGMARANVMRGKTDVDLEMLQEISAKEDKNFCTGLKARYMGEVLLNFDDQYMPEAELWIKKAISANTESGMRFMLAQDYARYAEFYKRQNDILKAQKQINKAIEIMRKCCADGWVERYEKELADLS